MSEVVKETDDFVKDPSTVVEYNPRHRADAVNSDANDDNIKEEDGVEVEEENDGDIPGTGEDLTGAYDDEDEEDDDLYEEDEDDDDDEEEEYISK